MDQAEALRNARQFADTAYSAELNNAAREFSAKLQAIQNQLAARGNVLSGAMVRETTRLRGEQRTTLLTKRLELSLEGYELQGVKITDQIAAQTLDDVMKIRRTSIAAATSSGVGVGTSELPGGSGPHYAVLLEQYIPVTDASIKTVIDRRRLMINKSKQSPVNVYHVYGHQPRWNTNSIDNSVRHSRQAVRTGEGRGHAGIRQAVFGLHRFGCKSHGGRRAIHPRSDGNSQQNDHVIVLSR